MNFYKDCTYYSFDHFENAKNIGWLGDNIEYNRGRVSKEFIDKLSLYIKYRFNSIRNIENVISIDIFGQKYALGFAEIRVLSLDGKIKYAAPDMIYYYITEKGYKPPKEFIDAVLNGTSPMSEEYKDYVRKYDEENLWSESDSTIEEISETVKLFSSDIIKLKDKILYKKECLNLITKDGSLLNLAIKNKNIEIAEFLIENDIDINKFSGIELITAIKTDIIYIAKMLLDKGIVINFSDMRTNPLFVAIRKGNYEMVKLLIDYKIDINIRYTNEFVKDVDALMFAKICGKDKIFDYLSSLSI